MAPESILKKSKRKADQPIKAAKEGDHLLALGSIWLDSKSNIINKCIVTTSNNNLLQEQFNQNIHNILTSAQNVSSKSSSSSSSSHKNETQKSKKSHISTRRRAESKKSLELKTFSAATALAELKNGSDISDTDFSENDAGISQVVPSIDDSFLSPNKEEVRGHSQTPWTKDPESTANDVETDMSVSDPFDMDHDHDHSHAHDHEHEQENDFDLRSDPHHEDEEEGEEGGDESISSPVKSHKPRGRPPSSLSSSSGGVQKKKGKMKSKATKGGLPRSANRPQSAKKVGGPCYFCKTTESTYWRNKDSHKMCNPCGIRLKKYQVWCTSCHYVPNKEEYKGLCNKCGIKFRVFKADD